MFTARHVRLAGNLVARRENPLVERSLVALVETAHLAGATVAVAGIETDEQAGWWRERGADRLSGSLFSAPPGDLPAC